MPGRLQEPIFRKFPFPSVKQFTFRQFFERPPVFLVVFRAKRLGFGLPLPWAPLSARAEAGARSPYL